MSTVSAELAELAKQEWLTLSSPRMKGTSLVTFV